MDGVRCVHLFRFFLSLVFVVLLAAVPQTLAARVLYWTDNDTDRIYRAELDGSNRQVLMDASDGIDDPRGIAVDFEGGKIYWANRGTSTIHRANLDGTGAESLPISGLGFPADLELDLAAGKLYWADRDNDRIARANLDGSNVETVVSVPAAGNNDAPYFLELDSRGELFWSDFDSGVIHRTNLDGAHQESFVTGLSRVRDIAFYLDAEVLYWADRDASVIQRLPFGVDVTEPQTLFDAADGLDRPHGIALDADNGLIYWADTATGTVMRGSIDGSGSPETLFAGTPGVDSPWDVAIPEPPTGMLVLLASMLMLTVSGRSRSRS